MCGGKFAGLVIGCFLIAFKFETFFITPLPQLEQRTYLRRYDIIFSAPHLQPMACGVNKSHTFKLCKHRALNCFFSLLVAFLPYEDPPAKITDADKAFQE